MKTKKLLGILWCVLSISLIGLVISNRVQAQARSDMVLIRGGEYEMGRHVGGIDADELPLHDVYIDAFYMDIYEVTNQQYADGLNWAYGQGLIDVASGVVYKKDDTEPYCDTTTSSSYSRITWSGSVFGATTGKEDHPMVMVSWYGAVAYTNWRSEQEGRTPLYDLDTWECNFPAIPLKGRVWLEEWPEEEVANSQIHGLLPGYRLPTEAEWEYAARGGLHSPYCLYPWGDTLISNIANHGTSGDPYEFEAYPWTTPVGFYTGELHDKTDFGWPGSQTSYQTSNGENSYGLHDMAGNMDEWCNDRYDSGYYSDSPYNNPRGPVGGLARILRGGEWGSTENFLRCASRGGYTPEFRYYRFGFRLALD